MTAATTGLAGTRPTLPDWFTINGGRWTCGDCCDSSPVYQDQADVWRSALGHLHGEHPGWDIPDTTTDMVRVRALVEVTSAGHIHGMRWGSCSCDGTGTCPELAVLLRSVPALLDELERSRKDNATRASVAADQIFADEQKCQAAINADPTNPHLNGRLMGLQRARDIAVEAALPQVSEVERLREQLNAESDAQALIRDENEHLRAELAAARTKANTEFERGATAMRSVVAQHWNALGEFGLAVATRDIPDIAANTDLSYTAISDVARGRATEYPTRNPERNES